MPADVLIRAQRQARDAEQAVGPRTGDLRRRAQLTPVVGERLNVGDVVCLMRFPESIEPRRARLRIGGCTGNDGYERGDCVVHGSVQPLRGVPAGAVSR